MTLVRIGCMIVGVLALVAGGKPAFSASCDAILTHGLRNISISKSEEALVATNYFNHCQKNFETMTDEVMARAEVEIFGYGGGGGSFNRSQTRARLEQWCTTNASTAQQNRSGYMESQTFYQGAVSAWESCIRLDSKDITVTPVISPDGRTVDIGIVYRGGGKSGVNFTGLPVEGFSCVVTLPDGAEQKYPIEVRNQAIQVRCLRQAPIKQTLNGGEYEVLPRGTIGVQTASDPFQLFFAEEWNPPAPVSMMAKLEAAVKQAELPVGTVVASVLTPEQFLSPANPSYREGAWVVADGAPLPVNSAFQALTGETNAPDAYQLLGRQYLAKVAIGVRSSGQNVKELETAGLNWTWIATGREIQGNRYNNDVEQDVDASQVYIDDAGAVIAQGRTLNWKHSQWGAWRPGVATVLGLGIKDVKVNYFVKIN